MRLSFVIPAHNEEDYIGKCLDSILKESEGKNYDIEVVVVNNVSTDRTREIAQKYSDVKVVDEPQKGIVWARRAGFLNSSGELVANIDADTMLTAGWIDKVFKEFSKNPNLVALSGPFIYHDLPKKVNFLLKFFYYPAFLVYLFNRFVLRIGSMLQGGNFVVKRSALEKIGGYNTNIEFYGEDTDLARRLHKVGDVKFTFGLPIFSSGRRLAKEGAFTMGIRYGLNYFWMIFFKRPFSKKSIDIRAAQKGGKLQYKPSNNKKEWLIAIIVTIIVLLFWVGIGFLVYYLIKSGAINRLLS